MSYKIEINDNGKWIGNAVRLATREEAQAHADDLYARWMALTERPRVVESDDPVNYKIDESGAMISVAP